MELVDVALSDFTRRSRTLRVSHSDSGLVRSLELGETLLVRDPETGFHSAVVAEIEGEGDVVYTVVVGGRVPEDLAQEKLAGRAPASDPDSLSLHDVIALLGRARDDRSGRVPQPRQSDESQAPSEG